MHFRKSEKCYLLATEITAEEKDKADTVAEFRGMVFKCFDMKIYSLGLKGVKRRIPGNVKTRYPYLLEVKRHEDREGVRIEVLELFQNPCYRPKVSAAA